ncbi:tryptophan synthase beta subunit-like PLP-dependent enzyme [Globomyces pollinis-pini]|nr:tryptophan synthase beta subunit-like PLP-dependent enzyme [Globomyces pollinis-pini]
MHQITPIINAPQLAKNLGIQSVYLKLDNLQPGGSFKIRGLGYCIQNAIKKNPKLKVLVSSSGGNAGMASTIVANELQLKIVVFVPTTTSNKTINVLKENGAQVIVHGDAWDETHLKAMEYLESLPAQTGFYVHPFEHEDTWKGHSSLIKEIKNQIDLPDIIICSVGGGGLLCGILTGLLDLECKNTIVVAVETAGAASFAAAVKADCIVALPNITSIAKSLGAKQVSEGTLRLREKYGKHLVRSLVIDDQTALNSVIQFANDYRYLVEPACASSLAPVLSVNCDLLKSVVPELNSTSRVLVEVCGGFQVDLDMIESWKQSLQK